jgi:hypothetical protein
MATQKPATTTTDPNPQSSGSPVPEGPKDTLAPATLEPQVVQVFPRGALRTTCRACGGELINVQHEKTRKFAPIDLAPTLHGNIVALDNGCYRVLGLRALSLLPPHIRLYSNHYMTCPKADLLRYKRNSRTK